ncbi:MaoC family dehydratase [Clostridium beijerinckii]|jgi:3-hydroxybutyryl-CoA dehydratase|uniref:MaoC family dehydratase n=2 Tax=Clostridium beijerinckii TaxID=1520 RepID=A0AAE2RSW6_CLOBE|nr:MaoC family dehydratase [Clostridium beijerinckii]ABR36389.1 MaoC domain protein dehydratase [Clostridium beijerinckii NCIMB 8052]AIU02765.1 dehydratase [Clostridium beijerinckii ATCC 35702]MBF7808964.1 MaoC family dehydratase [Clostridium beijerinckii]NRT22547.1 3-hydroxybutyryl-CoA dehydratase [Clostridium beijerinckii]NRT64937.1 3-hydroxybutyryl-CoA dehydratase [Clostridium beijerinckii]
MKYYLNQSESFSKTISEYDIYNFAGISGDFNPIHVNKEKAKKSIFKDRIAHGILVSSFISTVLGMYMPGPGTIYLKQTLSFNKPVYIGDTITATVTIKEIIADKKIAKIETIVKNQKEITVIEGEAIVKLP